MDSLGRQHAFIPSRTGDSGFLGDEGCDIAPTGKHVHMQMKRARFGHWYVPVGRFSDAMTKLEHRHLAIVSDTPGSGSQQSSMAD